MIDQNLNDVKVGVKKIKPWNGNQEKKVPTHKHWRLEIFIDRQTITMYYK